MLSVSLAHTLIQLCASLCTVSLCEHTFPFVFERNARLSWFRPLHLNASVPGRWRIIGPSAEVWRSAGSCRGLRHSGCDRDCPSPRLWLVSRSEPRPREDDWKDSKTSNLGALMHRVPDDCNVLQLSDAVSLLLHSSAHYHTPFWAVSRGDLQVKKTCT